MRRSRGRVVGQVMSGMLMGILLAREVAGVISGAFGWRAVYFISKVTNKYFKTASDWASCWPLDDGRSTRLRRLR